MSIKLYDAEIEYLESTGTQWIDLGRKLNSSIDIIDIDFTLISQVSSTSGLFGARTAAGSKNFSAIIASNNNIVLDMNNGDFSRYRLNSGTMGYNKRCTVFMLDILRQINLNGKKVAETNTTAQSFITDYNAELFRISTIPNDIPSIRLHSFKWRQRGTGWIYDMLPVRVGQKGYMYDKVSGKLFGNSGTGSFVLGPDVAPGRYANEVAFLESWGNQYIDTGIKPSTDTKIELKCLYCKSGAGLTSYGSLIGADDRSNAYILNHSAVANFTYGTEFSNNFANPQTRLLIFDSTASPQNMRVYDEGGSLVTTLTCIRGVFEVNQNLYLFAVNRGGTPVYGSNRIMYCKIYDGDTLVRDYVPVEYNGIGYMYDKVSGLFFNNQGTGKFLFGSIAKACARSYTRRQLMVEGRKRLPYGYVELEYIQNTTGAWSTSAPYINTGLKPAADSVDGDTYSFEGAWSREGNLTSNWDAVFAANSGGSGASTWSFEYSGTSGTRIAVTTNTKGYKIINLSNGATGIKHTFKVSSSSVTIDNTTISAPTGKGTAITSNLLLFRRQSNGRGFPMKLYYFKVFKSGILLMDLIPCKNTNNVVGMFDLVSKSFFRSANSGTFVAGKIIY